ncbi:MAG: ABC transporter permease, partial [Anaerolineae bacterium]
VNAFFIVLGLIVPFLTAGLFYFAFGGMGSEDEGFELATVQVVVANEDEGGPGFSAGGLIVDLLKNAIPDLLEVREVTGAAEARRAVDRQEAAVAVIVPAGLSSAVMAPEGQANVEVYRDPTLTVGPSIVEGLVRQVVDAFAGSKIAAEVAVGQLAAQGVEVDAGTRQGLAMAYAQWAGELGATGQEGNAFFLDLHPLPRDEGQGEDDITNILGLIMAGMMVFYVFFTGAAAAESILQEEEKGTLSRLFTTPTPVSTILGGKFLANLGTLGTQVIVLLLTSSLIFGIHWGDPLGVVLAALGLVLLATSFGIMITSFLENTRQGGIIYGGVLTVLGMIGMIRVFTAGMPNSDNALQTVSLAVPHGWALRAFETLQAGGDLGDVFLPLAVMVMAGIVFFAIGTYRFQKRFA